MNFDPDGRSYLVFNGDKHTISLYSDGGKLLDLAQRRGLDLAHVRQRIARAPRPLMESVVTARAENSEALGCARTYGVGKRRPGDLKLWMIQEAHVWHRVREGGGGAQAARTADTARRQTTSRGSGRTSPPPLRSE